MTRIISIILSLFTFIYCVFGNDVSDLSPLVGGTGLKTLCLQGNEVIDINHLRGLTSLENLKSNNTP